MGYEMNLSRYARVLSAMILLPSITIVIAENTTVETHRGADIYLKYCAGCHGFDGEAAYKHAPSFSMGERLQRDDRELLQSVLAGKRGMPPWKDKLPVEDLRDAIAYLRIMHERYKKGDAPRQQELPQRHYLFKPVGEADMDWARKEIRD